MPDDLIHCPACNFELRLPVELYGSPVECPRCHSRFTAPAPAVLPAADRPPPGREYDATPRPQYDYMPDPARAANAVKAPAIILIVLSALLILGGVYGMATANNKDFQQLANDPNLSPEMRDFFEKLDDAVSPQVKLITNLVVVLLNLLALLGAVQMLRLRTYPLAIAGTVAAMIPLGCCCVVQLPVAIWALVVLCRSEVRAAFH
jgi:hypothetical protein